jgi:hypothetical protein
MPGNFGNPYQIGTQQWHQQQMSNHARENMQRLQDLQRRNVEFNYSPRAGHTTGWWILQTIGAAVFLVLLFITLAGV